jgi:pantetheine-phosphate adenylyltransferase
MTKVAVYAGTFDPITYGHLDLVERGAEIFGTLVLAVSADTRKKTLFTTDERVEICRAVVDELGVGNVEVTRFDGLLVNYLRQIGANVLLRGLRAYSDFEAEFQMALTNRRLAPEVETLFMMPKEEHSYISSSMAKEVAMLGGQVSDFLSPVVERYVLERVAEEREERT